jgi:hypothetical protein
VIHVNKLYIASNFCDMQFRLLAVSILLFLVSCGVKKKTNLNIEIPKIKYSKLIEENASKNIQDSESTSLKIKGKMSYRIGSTSQKLGLNFRISKGEKIWVSGDFFGIPVVKMLIEKDQVSYYNKIDKTYFEGSFEFIKQLTGINVSYAVIEKLLLGEVILDLNEKKYDMTTKENAYFLYDKIANQFFVEVAIYPFSFKTKSQSIAHEHKKKSFATYYNNYQNIDGIVFPKEFTIKAKNKDIETIITISYNEVKFNEKLSFPFKVPKECDQKIVVNPKEI